MVVGVAESRSYVYVRALVVEGVCSEPGDISFITRIVTVSQRDVVDGDWEGAALVAGELGIDAPGAGMVWNDTVHLLGQQCGTALPYFQGNPSNPIRPKETIA